MKRTFAYWERLGIWTFVFILLCSMSFDAGAVFFEKKYLVRQVGGKDILCDAYVVQKNDYVTLLLKQRGEIAYADFPEFLRIFGSLNPHVADVNTIYPDQQILIPLKILPPGSFTGQSSGTVSMPVITITNLPETLKQHSTEYQVQYGEWVSRLIARRFGAENSRMFNSGMELFKQLNPEIKDINQIHAGQKIRLPDPSIRNTPYYSAMFDRPGEPPKTSGAVVPVTVVETPPPAREPLKTAEPEKPAESHPVLRIAWLFFH